LTEVIGRSEVSIKSVPLSEGVSSRPRLDQVAFGVVITVPRKDGSTDSDDRSGRSIYGRESLVVLLSERSTSTTVVRRGGSHGNCFSSVKTKLVDF